MSTAQLRHPRARLPDRWPPVCHLHPSRINGDGHTDGLHIPCYRSITIAAGRGTRRRAGWAGRYRSMCSDRCESRSTVRSCNRRHRSPRWSSRWPSPIARCPSSTSARDVLYLSPRSIDSRLSRLHRALGLEQPLHRVPVARSGPRRDRRQLGQRRRRPIPVARRRGGVADRRRATSTRRWTACSGPTTCGETARSPGNGSETRTPRRRSVAHATTCCRVGGAPGSRPRASDSTVVPGSRRAIGCWRWTSEPDAPSPCWHARIVSDLDSSRAGRRTRHVPHVATRAGC